MMSSILNNIFAKSSPAPRSVNGDKESRGTKRKAKSDPYDEIDDDDPVQKTPSTQRTRSRISSEAPNSSTKGRPPSAGKTNKRLSRSSGVRRSEVTDSPRVDAAANLARAQEPEAARLHPQPEEESSKNLVVPVADMGIPGPSNDKPEPANNIHDGNNTKGKEKATAVNRTEQTLTEADEREEKEVQALLRHRMAQGGIVEFLVHWVGESEDDATWEVEEEIQQGAEETLYAYWKAQGGRINALFIKPKNAPLETYRVFKLLGHEKKVRGGFEFEVQWVGHPPTRGETSFEAEAKLKKIAPEALDQYWKDLGGREKFLARRGRGKKQRTE
ncbi:putative chromo domain-containing protein [Daldinia childiae]|uniref:putative chromo domain-containing protein n=1 Tax=Daldinia childiae TaxID=326645 RepID=UPI001447E62D|nr:putative chromo domain-containing protein [Daldinia childiae]KAF3065296.1 putative chromo domain-containing protein [Daldinia childiae]